MTSTIETTAAVKSDRKARKPRRKPARTLRLLEAPTPDTAGWGAFRVTEGRKSDLYIFRELEARDGGAAAFTVEKLDPDSLATVESYAVRVGKPAECSCECKGWEYRKADKPCRHVAGLLALDARGLLRQKHAACPQCQDASEGGALCSGCYAEQDYFDACDAKAEMEAAGLDPWDCPEANQRYMPAEAAELDW